MNIFEDLFGISLEKRILGKVKKMIAAKQKQFNQEENEMTLRHLAEHSNLISKFVEEITSKFI